MIAPIDGAPRPPAAWLAPCPAAAPLPEGRPVRQGEAWGAVVGPDGVAAERDCERAKRACLRAWHTERLWTLPPSSWPRDCRTG